MIVLMQNWYCHSFFKYNAYRFICSANTTNHDRIAFVYTCKRHHQICLIATLRSGIRLY